MTLQAAPTNGATSNFCGGPSLLGATAGPRKTRLDMKITNSLKSLKGRHRDNRVIRRRGRTYVINKTNRRFKARQG
ncbi:hypothetical protein NTCA1_21280 [Novosphingobium sp. TCA1]|nr:hypothetical protein NTCA1_21280 [Novosphingobium sp. TCA1]